MCSLIMFSTLFFAVSSTLSFIFQLIHDTECDGPVTAITSIPPSLTFSPTFDLQIHREYYVPYLQQLLREIGYRHDVSPLPDHEYHQAYHEWLHSVFAPASGWRGQKLENLGEASCGMIARCYPYANVKMKMLVARLTTVAIAIDDSIEDDEMCREVAPFTHRLYLGEPQPPGILTLYHECLKELSRLYEGDPVERGFAITSWITFVESCLLEKRLYTEDLELRASPWDNGYEHLLKHANGSERKADCNRRQFVPFQREALAFPQYLRRKTGLAEGYAFAIFKTHEDQKLPLTRFVKAMGDVSFFIEGMNDVLSFYKEEVNGEIGNFIHLRTQVLRSSLAGRGSGPGGEWTVIDTFRLLCNELRDATFRIDTLLGLHENETNWPEAGEEDMAIARQWRAFRDGYISGHIESDRYKLDFLRPSSTTIVDYEESMRRIIH